MNTLPALATLVQGRRSEKIREWYDALARFQVRSASRQELIFEGNLEPGHYFFRLRTARGQFPMETTRIALKEWPSLRTLHCGPFDIDHTTYKMVVPCFHVRVDDQPPVLAWFDIPSADMVENRYFETEFGIVAEQAGPHTIRLRFRNDEKRIGWFDVEELSLYRDLRQPAPCPVAATCGLWATPARWEQLGQSPSPMQKVCLDSIRKSAVGGLCGTYTYRIILLSLLVKLGEKKWVSELRERVNALLERPHWGFHTVEGELGCDNDRDAGLRLMEISTAYAWAPEVFSKPEHRRMREKIIRHAEILYRFTIVQKAYWPDTTVEAHGLGGWVGLATAAAALLDEHPAARVWLDWSYGNFRRNAALFPDDAHVAWFVFNQQWAVYLLALFESLAGRKLATDTPFFENCPIALRDLYYAAILDPVEASRSGAVGGGVPEEITLMAYLGARNGNREASSLVARWITRIAEGVGNINPLVPLLIDPAATPSKEANPPQPFTVRAENGLVASTGQANGHTFHFRLHCGAVGGPAKTHQWNRYAQFFFNPNYSGSYLIVVDGTALIAPGIGAYDHRTNVFPLVSINGNGHIIERRYGGYCLRPDEYPWIRHFHEADGFLYLQADLRPSYRRDLPLTRMLRHMVVIPGAGLVVVLDEVAARQPVRFAHHVTTPVIFQPQADGHWIARDPGKPPALHVAACMPRGYAGRVQPIAYVPSYSAGLNSYKDKKSWQPEVHARFRQPPDFQRITHASKIKARAFVGAVIYSLSPLSAKGKWTGASFELNVNDSVNGALRLAINSDQGILRPDKRLVAGQLSWQPQGAAPVEIAWDVIDPKKGSLERKLVVG